MGRKIQILDTTLRDGNKLPFVILNTRDRLEIARQLARLGVDIIDAGYPVSSKEDRESVALIAGEVEGPYISALSRALDLDIEEALRSLEKSKRPYLHIFLPIFPLFLSRILKKSKEETLKMIEHTVRLGARTGVEVQFSLCEIGEAEREFMLEAGRTACAAGAGILNFADTNGTLHPEAVREMIAEACGIAGEATKIGVHFHNDLGLATANTLAAIEAGAEHAEVTVGGLGPKSGNTPLEELVFGLEVFAERLKSSHGIRLEQIYKTSSLVSRITGIQPHPNKPIIGRQADSFFGDQDLSIAGFKRQLDNLEISLQGINLEKVYNLYRSQAKRKKSVHISEVLAMVEDARLEEKVPYALVSFNVMTGSSSVPVGIVELKKDDRIYLQSSHGTGTIDALCQAVDKAVGLKPQLILYSVDSLTESLDARAEGEFYVDGEYLWE